MFQELGLNHDLEDLNSVVNRMDLEPYEDQSLLTGRQENRVSFK